MIIGFPEEMFSENIAKGFEEMGYRVVGKQDSLILLEGVFSLRITADRIGLNTRRFIDLSRRITVEKGRKKRRGTTLFIEPLRKHLMMVRLSDDEWEALERVAKDRGYTKRKLSTFFRDSLITALITKMEKEGKL